MTHLTLEQIGELAGVSRSTVSRVINNHPNVSSDVRERVQRIIKETGFSPNLAARTLASQRSFVIGLVIPRSVQSLFGDPYFARLTQGIVQAANMFDHTVSLFLLESREIEDRIMPRITRPGFIDGLVVQSTAHDDKVLSRIVNSTIPHVVAGRPLDYENVTYIDVNNANGAFLAVEHLIKLGHQRIGTVTGPLNAAPGRDRKKGYLEALKQYDHPMDKSLIVEADFTEWGGYQATKQVLTANPDALFIASDQMGIGALQAIREAGLRVPEDIALVGFDDLPPALYANPQLTTIRQPIMRFGIAAVEMLIHLIEDQDQPPQVTIMDVDLVVRDSCGGKR